MGLAVCNLLYDASVDMPVEMLNHRKTVMVGDFAVVDPH